MICCCYAHIGMVYLCHKKISNDIFGAAYLFYKIFGAKTLRFCVNKMLHSYSQSRIYRRRTVLHRRRAAFTGAELFAQVQDCLRRRRAAFIFAKLYS